MLIRIHRGRSKQTLLDVNDIPVLHVVIHGNTLFLHLATGIPTVADDPALGSLTGDAATGGKRLNHGHAAFQAVLPWLLDLAIDVEHGRAGYVERVAAVKLDVIGLIPGGRHLYDVHVASEVFSASHSGYRDHLAAGGPDSAGRREHAGNMAAGGIDRVAPGFVHFPDYRHQIAKSFRQQDIHLRVADKTAVPEHFPDFRFSRRK